MGVKLYLIAVLIFFFLMTIDIEHLFIFFGCLYILFGYRVFLKSTLYKL